MTVGKIYLKFHELASRTSNGVLSLLTGVSTIAEIALPTSEFALSETFSQVPSSRFEVVGIVAHKAEYVMPQLRATASDISTVERAFEDDRTITDADLLTKQNNRGLFSVRWCDIVHDVLSLLATDDTTVLTARAANFRWNFRIQFSDHDLLSAVYNSCHDAGVPIEVQNVHKRTTMLNDSQKLTEHQHETLQSAMERGYYDIPRKVTTKDLAEELGVSHQAISERLRRGHRCLVETSLSSASE